MEPLKIWSHKRRMDKKRGEKVTSYLVQARGGSMEQSVWMTHGDLRRFQHLVDDYERHGPTRRKALREEKRTAKVRKSGGGLTERE